ncbi:MAG TPA: biotin--[acetyl-CoA-carboxylase] ligase [Acidimicrobiales bacterium]|nr:biotin--[acetyl-CoA-carboxylase] ligase [Acidimicrobiales bacterium]
MSPLLWRVEHFEEIDSTNSYLKQRAVDGCPEGLVTLADFQTAGRGRLDRAWISPPRSSLLCSIVLRPRLDADELQLVVAAVALATRHALERLSGLRADLKWPNDLIVRDRKLGGLLAEIVVTPQGYDVVVGLGLNLTFDGPEEVEATSVKAETGLTLAPRGVLDLVLEELEVRREQLDSAEGRARLRADYERALATIGTHVRVEQHDGATEGIARGVDQAGRLLIDVAGEIQVFGVGDVVHLRASDVHS